MAKNDEFLCLLTIHEEDELAAVLELKYREHRNYPEYEHWIGGVFVVPEHRDKGFAAALIRKAKAHARDLGVPTLYLQCEKHNDGLYLKQGFRPLHAAVHHGVENTIFQFETNP